jgi:hypothetical protein
MDKIPVTRAYLNSLTTSDLIKMADNFGVDMPQDLDRIFIIEELLEIATADVDSSENSQEMDFQDLVFMESVPLPKQYNITFIEAMVRDPLWAFVFWEIKAIDKELYEKAPDFNGYYLKVFPLVKSTEKTKNSSQEIEEEFTVSVTPNDTAWYLSFLPVEADGISRLNQSEYNVELCVSLEGNETVLAVSNPIKLPDLPPGVGKQASGGASESPLIRLSGYGDFNMLRRNERNPRIKGVKAH